MHRRIRAESTYRIVEMEESSPLYTLRENFLRYKIKPVTKEDFTTPARPGNFISLKAKILTGPHRGRTLQLIGVRILRVRPQDTCNCAAYQYPHKPGFGACKEKA